MRSRGSASSHAAALRRALEHFDLDFALAEAFRLGVVGQVDVDLVPVDLPSRVLDDVLAGVLSRVVDLDARTIGRTAVRRGVFP
jgi:hypothetical protein